MNAHAAVANQAAFHPALVDHNPAGAVSWNDMVSHRGYMGRFAQRKLHDPMLAEDVVHDVFEAVLFGRASFGGRGPNVSAPPGQLKNKMADPLGLLAGDRRPPNCAQ